MKSAFFPLAVHTFFFLQLSLVPLFLLCISHTYIIYPFSSAIVFIGESESILIFFFVSRYKSVMLVKAVTELNNISIKIKTAKC